VLHVIPSVAPRDGGPSSSIVPMCRALAERGIHPTLVATDADGPGRLDVPLDTVTSWHGVQARFFPRQFTEAFKYSRPLARWIDCHVREFSVVHVHAILSHAPLAAARAAERHRVPYIVRPLGTLDPWSLRQKAGRKRLLLRAGAARLLQGAGAIHYTSAEEQRSVERTLHLTRGVVIPLGVDVSRLSEDRLTDEDRARTRYVLALSRLHPVKNLEALIDAFADVAGDPAARSWTLIVAGDGDPEYAARLRERIAQRQAAEVVKLAGWVDGEAKRRLVGGASVFALPSFHENFGVSLVEAMAAGVPALVSSSVHLAEDIRSAAAGWTVDPGRDSIAAALHDAIGNTEGRRRKGAAAAALAARYAWPIVAGSLVELYGRLASRSETAAAPVPRVPAGAIGS
jgi:glycosyltransferase involved in cell wall biosynthesis